MSNSIAFELAAESRQEVGKAAARRLRREGKVPATVYGADKQPESITLLQNEVMKTLSHEAVFSHILDLTISGKKEKVVIKAVERHVTKPLVMHLDFLRINASEAITIQVPLEFVNEDKCPGVQKGGLISHLMTTIDVKCLPGNLPESIKVDTSALDLNHPLHLSDIKLPSGVEFAHGELDDEHDLPIISANAPKTGASEESTEAEAAEGESEQQAGDENSSAE